MAEKAATGILEDAEVRSFHVKNVHVKKVYNLNNELY